MFQTVSNWFTSTLLCNPLRDAVGTAWAQPHLLLKRLKILLLDILRWGQSMTEWQGISLEKKSDVSECSEKKKTKQLQHVATMSSKIDYNIQLQGKSNMLYYSVFCCRVLTFFLQTPSCSMFQVLTCQSSSCAKWSINYPQQNLCLCACIILDSLSKAMVSWCLLTVEGCIYIGSTT